MPCTLRLSSLTYNIIFAMHSLCFLLFGGMHMSSQVEKCFLGLVLDRWLVPYWADESGIKDH